MPANRDRLVIIRGEFEGSDVQFAGGETFKVCFNPTEYTVAKKTGYAEAAVPGLDAPILQFSKGEARTLAVELLLDSYTYGQGEDVRALYVQALEKVLLVKGNLHAPPPCKVVWGSFEFVGLLENLSTRYVMFADDGTPVRARATLNFKEYLTVKDQLATEPRSSPDRRKIHLVRMGDTLWQLAHKLYGDPSHWKTLAEANDIANPRMLEPGTQLIIPPLKPKEEFFADAR